MAFAAASLQVRHIHAFGIARGCQASLLLRAQCAAYAWLRAAQARYAIAITTNLASPAMRRVYAASSATSRPYGDPRALFKDAWAGLPLLARISK
jgi:hypothetical protein